jgi:thiamine biosynthesis lipoprotein
MGTRFNLLLPGIGNSDGDMLFSSCVQELNRIEKMLSCLMPGSDISQINENAFNRPVEINDELSDIMIECLKYSEMTQGTFDISIGKIIDHWNGRERKGK